MQDSGFAAPIVVKSDGTSVVLRPIPLTSKSGATYNEDWLLRLLYKHPQALPVAEIDDSFSGLIPLCMQMSTPCGFVDAVFVTPNGRLALLETKLWRNPEARREVVGQILDYAKELTNWDYSRFESSVHQARKISGEDLPGLSEFVSRRHPALISHRFQDAVTKSLARGDFLLIIAGDGIREGISAIAQYLDRNSALHFTFGLVECAIFETHEGHFYVQPRVLAHTTKLTRTIVAQADGRIFEIESTGLDDSDRPELIESRERYQNFWTEFLGRIRLEAAQPIPAPARSTNQYFMMPKGANAWVSAYLGQSRQDVGVYLRMSRGEDGDKLYEALLRDRIAIDAALGVKADWLNREVDGANSVIITRKFPGNLLTESREDVQGWLADHLERFVSVFRPRIEHLLREQSP